MKARKRDIDARREIYVQQILIRLFLINQQALRQYFKTSFGHRKNYQAKICPLRMPKILPSPMPSAWAQATVYPVSFCESELRRKRNTRQLSVFHEKDHFILS